MSAKSSLVIRWAAVLLLAAILLGGLVGRAQAVEIIHQGSIPAGQTIDDDVVIADNQVTVDGTVNGTLMAFGNTITINGTVKSDVIAAGQDVIIGEKAVIEGNLFAGGSTITVRGKINGSIFGGAMSMSLAGSPSVARNLYFGGYDLQTSSTSVITRDIYAGAYQVVLAGTSRNVGVAAEAIEVNGTINGDANFQVGAPGSVDTAPFRYFRFAQSYAVTTIQPGLRIAEGAKISGKLTYTSTANQGGAIQAVPGGGIVYQTPVPTENRTTRLNQPQVYFPGFSYEGFWLWGILRNLVTILILGALALGLVPAVFQKTVAQLQQRTLASLAVGLLELAVVLLAIPMIAIGLVLLGIAFSLVTLLDVAGIIVGLGFAAYGLGLAVFFTLFLWTGKLVLSLIIGAWILGKLAPQASGQRFWSLALGAVVFALLAAIPIFGFLFTFVVDLAGVGALWYVWRSRRVPA